MLKWSHLIVFFEFEISEVPKLVFVSNAFPSAEKTAVRNDLSHCSYGKQNGAKRRIQPVQIEPGIGIGKVQTSFLTGQADGRLMYTPSHMDLVSLLMHMQCHAELPTFPFTHTLLARE